MTYEYIGGGDWLPAVPARDLSEAEAKEHAEVLATESGKRLYRVVNISRATRAVVTKMEDKEN